MNFPSALYKDPVLLDRNEHRGKRISKLTDFSVAAEMNAMFVNVVEFAEAAKEYPITFLAVPESTQDKPVVSPVVLLGLRDRENLFVNGDKWDARYIPGFVRRYPLAYTKSGDDRVSVVIDQAWPGFNGDDGELLVDPSGEAAPYLKQMMEFLDAYEREGGRTRAFCERLVQLDLLRGGTVDGQLPDGSPLRVEGFFAVDEQKLLALPDADLLELTKSGAMGLIHAHMLSMSNVQRLFERLGQRLAAATAPSQTLQ